MSLDSLLGGKTSVNAKSRTVYTIGSLSHLYDEKGEFKKDVDERVKKSIGDNVGVLSQSYVLLENLEYCSHTREDDEPLDDTREVYSWNLTKNNSGSPVQYLIRELFDYLASKKGFSKFRGVEGVERHNVGLTTYFNDLFNKLEKDASGEEFNVIEESLKRGNIKPFLEACRLRSENINSEDVVKYFTPGLCKGLEKISNSSVEFAGSLLFQYSRLPGFKEKAKNFLPQVILDASNDYEEEILELSHPEVVKAVTGS